METVLTNVRAPIQLTKERQPQHLKRWLFINNRPIHFHINSTSLKRLVNQTSWVFPTLKSTSHFLPQYKVPQNSETNSNYCHRSRLESSIININSNTQITSSGGSLMYSGKNVGPGMEPWGPPALTGYSCEDFPYRTTWRLLLLRKSEIQWNLSKADTCCTNWKCLL